MCIWYEAGLQAGELTAIYIDACIRKGKEKTGYPSPVDKKTMRDGTNEEKEA